ncbi:MAG: DEAD/DEAH box helicase [Chloroflexi bacterium]|nr:DEAD/DEAH box helicase [Chloroflexota bacterium]
MPAPSLPDYSRADALVAEFRATLPYELDPFQVDAMQALARGHSVLVAAPTGTGKTVVGEFGVWLALKYGSRAIYTTPIKALSNQKFRDFQKRFGAETVGLLTGDVVVNPDAAVRVMTTEVLRNVLVTGESRAPRARPTVAPPLRADGAPDASPSPPLARGAPLDDVGAIVFDEVHYMGDPERGTAWEESILLAPRHLPLVCLSATVPNASEVAEWIRDAHGELTCIFHEERAVPLEHRYWVPPEDPEKAGSAFKVYTVLTADGTVVSQPSLRKIGGELAGKVRFGGVTSQGFRGHEDAGGEDRAARELPDPWRVIRYLEGEGLTPAIYFVFSRRATEESALSCLALKPVEHGRELVQEAKERLAGLSPEDRALRQVALLFRLLPRGVAVHHAGMLPQLKMLVEELFQSGKLRAVFATDTLALGINMPAKTVVVAEMLKYDGVQRRPLTPNEYRQMTGRAGRRGIDERGVSLVLYSPWVPFMQSMGVMSGELLPLESAFRPTYSTAMNLWLQPEDEERLADLYARSLRRFQHDRDLKELTEQKQALEDAFELQRADPGGARRQELWERAQELSSVDVELRRARRVAAQESRRTVGGLARVLERYDYLRDGRPTYKAPYLRAMFDTNALTLSELIVNQQLEALEPAELAEALSWFSTDRDSPMRGLQITRRLERLRDILDHLHGGVLREEERQDVQISRPLPPDFHGMALAWAHGDDLADIARRSRLQEGDLVGALQKTLDLIGQVRGAALRGPLGEKLVPLLDEADGLLRRGVVEASYQWAVGGLPEVDEDGESNADVDLDWEVPVLFEEESPGGFRRNRDRPSPRDRRPAAGTPGGPRRGEAARKARKERTQAKLAPPPTAPPKPRRKRR